MDIVAVSQVSSGCCLCEFSHGLSVSTWVSSVYSGFIPPHKNMLVGGLAPQNYP